MSQADKPATSSAFRDGGLNKEETPSLTNTSMHDSFHNKSDLQSDISSEQNGFFVSFGNNVTNSPKVKPKLSSVKTERAVTPEPASLQNQTQHLSPQNQSSQQNIHDTSATEGNTSVNSQKDNVSHHDSSGIGFVIGGEQENLTKVSTGEFGMLMSIKFDK
jgi:hypothetical protein